MDVESNQIVLAFDPGGTTGVALWAEGRLIWTTELIFEASFNDFFFVLGEALTALQEAKIKSPLRSDIEIVIEEVSARSRTFDERAIEAMGIIKYIFRAHPITMHPPAKMKGPRTWPNVDLKGHPSQHVRDAVSHILAYTKTTTFSFPTE